MEQIRQKLAQLRDEADRNEAKVHDLEAKLKESDARFHQVSCVCLCDRKFFFVCFFFLFVVCM